MAERKSVDELTADLIQTPSEPTDTPTLEVVESEVIDEVLEDAEEDFIPPEGVEVETGHEEVQDEEEEDVPSEGTEDDEEQEEAHDENEDETSYLDISDDDLIEVKVDGEVVYRTVEDAKRALSGEGAIEKRLKEATEQRKAAHAAYDSGLQELEERRVKIVDTVQSLDDFIFQPLVGPPPQDLRVNNPQQYIAHSDAYKADQARIEQGRAELKAKLQQQRDEHEQYQQQRRVQTERQLIEAIPELSRPEAQKPIMDKILSVAESYGFSNEDLANFFDARAYKLAYDLAMLREAKPRGKVDTKKIKDTAKKRPPRRLRSGVAQKMAKSRTSKKAQEQITERARSTGKVDDVTRMILSKPGRPRR